MMLDKRLQPVANQYRHDHTRAWSSTIASSDGYAFVEARFVGHGYTMGGRAVESLRLVMAAPQVATVRPQVGLSLLTDLHDLTHFRPTGLQKKSLNTMLAHLVAWSRAMRSLSGPSAELVAAEAANPRPPRPHKGGRR
jgi:NAD(P)H-dependent FMN reductase